MRVRLLFSNKKKETVEREWSQVVICELSTPLSELEYPTIRRVCSRYLRVKLNWNELVRNKRKTLLGWFTPNLAHSVHLT